MTTTTMQDKALGQMRRRIERFADTASLDWVEERSAANCGTVRVQHGWVTLLKLGYSFQGSYATLTIQPVSKRQASGFQGLRGQLSTSGTQDPNTLSLPHLDYDEALRWQHLMGLWSALVKAAAQEAAGEGEDDECPHGYPYDAPPGACPQCAAIIAREERPLLHLDRHDLAVLAASGDAAAQAEWQLRESGGGA